MVDYDVNKVWEDIKEVIKQELNPSPTDISYNTWINSLIPLCFDETDSLILASFADFHREIVVNRYSLLILNALRQLYAPHLGLKVILPTEVEQYKKYQKSKQDQENELSTYLNPKYTFDTFVVGNNNRLAHAAALAVAETSPGERTYNPLFIYGGVGLGKTHLMHAIGHHVLKNHPNAKIMYVTSEMFTNELIAAIRDEKNDEFRAKYRSVDVLLIDDIQFLGGKERTQEEFFHTFNALYEANKKIILSSDRPPKEITTLEDRLRSRFEWGLITDIQAPDFETRIAILSKKCQLEGISVPQEVLEFIATKIETNIRELEGALNKIIAYSKLISENHEINLELAEKALKEFIASTKQKEITIEMIQAEVANYYNIKFEDFKSSRRSRNIAFPRQVAMYISREITNVSLPKIGEAFGGKDHTTVLHACEKIKELINKDSNLRNAVETIKKRIINN
ncbi:chromosomal replication initiator protein DnaA [Caldicellulosiruptoraceae bacterium PP1]